MKIRWWFLILASILWAPASIFAEQFGSEAGVGPVVPQAADQWMAQQMWWGDQMTQYEQAQLLQGMRQYQTADQLTRIQSLREAALREAQARRMYELRQQCGSDDPEVTPTDATTCKDLENNLRFGMPLPPGLGGQ